MWLVDSLPNDLQNARVMTVRFDTNLADNRST